MDFADQLQARLDSATAWPITGEDRVVEQLKVWAAFREADKGVLTTEAGWDGTRTYVPDPLPERIADVWGDLIFGEDPEFTAATDADQDRLEALVEENDLPSELQRAAGIASSEGEVWWRVFADRDAAEAPTIEWVSRRLVVPLWRGRRLLAAAFVSELASDDAGSVVWRYVDVQAPGVARNLLYRGSRGTLGRRVDLGQRSETEDLVDEWRHGFPMMLAGRVMNRHGRDPRLGVSDFAGVKDMLLALNEATTIGHENARLTLKRRAIVPQEVLDRDGNLPAGDDLFVSDPGGGTMGSENTGPFKVLEYSFDADALIAYKGDLADTILTRCRVAPQLVGRHVDKAESGAALRARLLDSVLAANGKARFWDDALPKVLLAAQLVDQLPEEQGGFGRQWATAGEPPAVERASVLPEDPAEEVARHATAVQAEIEARRTAVEALHPDWDDKRVDEEIAAIRADTTIQLPELPEQDPDPGAAGV